MDHSKFLTESNRLYDEAFDGGNDRFSRVKGSELYRQYYRFSELVHFMPGIETEKFSVLDVGCGNGELFHYLNFRGFSGRYDGVDINDKLLEDGRAQFSAETFPDVSFRNVDILSQPVEQADYVVLSGVFNIVVGQDDRFHEAMLTKMFEAARRAVVFNAVSTHVNFRNPQMFYIDPAQLIDFIARTLSKKFELRHHFLPHNYTVCIHRDVNWAGITERRNARR